MSGSIGRLVEGKLASRLIPWGLLSSILVLVGTAARGESAAPVDKNHGDELAAKVLPIFDVKCGVCHGPQAKKKEKFGYVTDLVKLAANPKLVVKGSSAKSKVWTSIEEGDMPPSDDDRSKPLTSAEKEIIKAWLEAGAPPGVAALATTTSPSDSMGSVDGDPTEGGKFPKPSLFRRLAALTGKLHPLVAHFPIALLMAAGMAEAGWFFTRSVAFTGAVRFCVVIGGMGAIGAAALGWVNAVFRHSQDPLLLFQHRWLGTVAGLWAIPVVLLCELGIRRTRPGGMDHWRGASRTVFQISLVVGAALIGLAAHIGGSLVYGEDYFKL